MRTISRYLLSEFGKASVAVFAGLYLIFVAGDTMLHLDRLADRGLSGLFWILGRSLELISVGVPIACVAGIVWSLTRAVRFREVTAIRSSGVPLQRALAPVVGASLLVAVGVGLFQDRLVVPVKVALASEETGGGDEARRVFRSRGHYWHANEGAHITAKDFDEDSRTLTGVTAFLFDDRGRAHQRVDAATAQNLNGDVWEFRNAVVLGFDEGSGLERRDSVVLRQNLGLAAGDVARAVAPAEMTTLHKLSRRIREHAGDAEQLRTLQATFHSRLAQPLTIVILVLAAVPFAIGDVERGDSLARAMLMALGAAAIYFTCWTLALLAAQRPEVPPALPIWGVSGLALAVALVRWRSIPQ